MSVNLELLEALINAEKKLLALEHMVGGGDDEISLESEILSARAAIAHAEAAMCQGHAREGERDNPWKQAVIERLVVAHIYSAEHENDPLKAVFDLLAYESDLAADPRVSAAAERLVMRAMAHARDAAISEAADRCEAICHEQMRIGTERGAAVADQCKDAVRRLRDGDVHTCTPPHETQRTEAGG